MKDITRYSEILHCLHDEEEPHGRIGRGTHYSIFRIVTWHDTRGRICPRASIQDFGVIWDEDHDPRVIGVAERMYVAGLMYPVLYIGERKGILTVVLCREFAEEASKVELDDYKERVRHIATVIPSEDGGEDSWCAEFAVFSNRVQDGNAQSLDATVGIHGSLIADDGQKVDIYLRNINNLWSLGHKSFTDIYEIDWALPLHQGPRRVAEQQSALIDSLRKICLLQGQKPIPPERQTALNAVAAELLKHKSLFMQALSPRNDVGIDCSAGVGNQPYIPWVRIHSLDLAPGPTRGCCVDLLFSWDKKLYLVILHGAGRSRKNQIVRMRDIARNTLTLADPNSLDGFLEEIELYAPGGQSAQPYELGTVLAEQIDLEQITEEELLGRICVQIKLLAIIYEASLNERSVENGEL